MKIPQELDSIIRLNQISSFNYQVYLDKLQADKFRKSLCRLRLASHRLEIETGRWTKPIKTPLEDRKCKLCGRLEDEYHFVFECSLYLELKKYIYLSITGKGRA